MFVVAAMFVAATMFVAAIAAASMTTFVTPPERDNAT
jgi:hypothetical protein